MPGFDTLDFVFMLAMALFILWELFSIVAMRGKVRLRGNVFGRPIAIGIFAVVISYAVWIRRDTLFNIWLTGGLLFAGCVLYMLLPAGLSDDGFYFNGKRVLYSKIKYYNVERESEKGFSLRLSTGTRDYVLDFPKNQMELVMAYMTKGNIPDFKTANSGGSLQ